MCNIKTISDKHMENYHPAVQLYEAFKGFF